MSRRVVFPLFSRLKKKPEYEAVQDEVWRYGECGNKEGSSKHPGVKT